MSAKPRKPPQLRNKDKPLPLECLCRSNSFLVRLHSRSEYKSTSTKFVTKKLVPLPSFFHGLCSKQMNLQIRTVNVKTKCRWCHGLHGFLVFVHYTVLQGDKVCGFLEQRKKKKLIRHRHIPINQQ
jgi:hypothetical protein